MLIEPATLTGRVDREDRLTGGDPAFLALNARSGGTEGQALAIPPLATIVRLARRLRILVSRRVAFADGDSDFDCWVRARPDEDGVTLTIADLRERAIVRPFSPPEVAPPPGADWSWETDSAMRLRHVPVDVGARFGFDATAAIGRPLTRLFTLDAGEDGGLPILEALAARQDFEGQLAILRDTGRRVRLAANARIGPDGAFAGFVGGTFADEVAIAPEPGSERAGLSETFSLRLDRALRAPLGRIIAGADTIHAEHDGPLAAHYVDYAADIASAGRHLLGLVDDLVDLEAIERADFGVAADPIDLADVARRAAGLLAVRASDAGVTIDRPGTAEAAPATGEFRRTLQVLVNLIGNAVRYSPQGGTVWVRIQPDGPRVAVIVADQGKGIASEDQARIFEKFARVDSGEPGGSGLGLYIARRLARAMGGDLTVDSAPGAGARFVFTLPAG